MPDLEPITRDERLWIGEDLEPITRREMYIKHLYDETQVIPDKPITREEMFILKAGEELHDVTIEQLNVTENGTYSETGKAYSPVIVEVPETTLTTLNVTENGTYTAPSGTAYNEVDVEVPLPENAYLLKDIPATPTAIATFTDGAPLPLPKLEIAIEPQQDLHGYDSPWVGGAGKNKLENSAVSSTSSGVTYTVNSDTTISCSGTATATSYLTIAQNYSLKAGTYILNGCPEGGGIETMRMSLTRPNANVAFDTGSGAEFTLDSDVNDLTLNIRIGSGQNVSRQVFKPMIRLATETDPTFESYSNICPISGWTECNVSDVGKNWLPVSKGYNFEYNANIGSVLDVSTDVPDWSYVGNDNYEVTLSDWQRSGLLSNKIPNGVTAYVRIKIVSGTPRVTTYTIDKDYKVVRKFSNYNPATDGLDYNTQIQIAEGECYVAVAIVGSNHTVVISKPHIVFDVDESYSPYNGHTYTINLNGTRYGGKLRIINGVAEFVADRASIKLNDLTWTKQNTTSNNWRFKSSQFIQNIKLPTNPSIKSDDLCSVYQNITANETWTADKTGIAINADGSLLICDLNQADTNALGAVIANQTYCYELATPTIIPLGEVSISSLLGTNNVWADTGNILSGQYFGKGE